MNFNDLKPVQAELDKHIMENHGLEYNDERVSNILLAFGVEVAEVANETRCFKDWSTKGPSDKSVIIEEYADALHFALSLSNYFDVPMDLSSVVDEKETNNYLASISLQELFIANLSSPWDVFELMEDIEGLIIGFILLGMKLGFTEEEIREAYHAKHEVNYKRQEEGY